MAIGVVQGSTTGKLPVTVEAVGARPDIAFRLIDELGSGAQKLNTAWVAAAAAAAPWFSVDLSAGHLVAEIRIAPRGDQKHVMDIWVGDALTAGRVTGAPVARCTTAGSAPQVPTALVACPANGSGRYVTVQVVNRAGFKVHGVEVHGAAGNGAPVLAPIGARTVTAGSALDVTLSAHDPEGAALEFGVNHDLPGSPNVLTDHGNGTARLFWAATASAIGLYSVTVTVTDPAGGEARETFAVAVVENQAPTITPIADRIATEHLPLAIEVAASDPDGPPPIALRVEHTLPGHTSFTDRSDGTGQFTWTPPAACPQGRHQGEERAGARGEAEVRSQGPVS
jgi:hypothetical protein